MAQTVVLVNPTTSLTHAFAAANVDCVCCHQGDVAQNRAGHLHWRPGSQFSLQSMLRLLRQQRRVEHVLFCSPAASLTADWYSCQYGELMAELNAGINAQLTLMQQLCLGASHEKPLTLGFLLPGEKRQNLLQEVSHAAFKSFAEQLIDTPPNSNRCYGVLFTANHERQLVELATQAPQRLQRSSKRWFVLQERKKLLLEASSRRFF